MFGYRRRRLIASSLKRATRWEFWPMWLFYIPVVIYIAMLTIRYRLCLAFSAVNPCMEDGGFVGESKSSTLLPLQAAIADKVALTELVTKYQALDLQIQQCHDFMAKHQLQYPVILKPDTGQRGSGVTIIESDAELRTYLQTARFDSILQEYIHGVEFGIFYIRKPEQAQGEVFSLTQKCFPSVTGDGERTLEALILDHPRLHYMARFLLAQHCAKLATVPAKNEQVNVVRLGSHCRGSLFLDGEQFRTAELEAAIDTVSQKLSGFYFGRYDIRADSIEALQRGDFKVIELNGVTSESTNIYDPKNSLFYAYRTLMTQWKIAFEIGLYNVERGQPTMGVFEMLYKTLTMNREKPPREEQYKVDTTANQPVK